MVYNYAGNALFYEKKGKGPVLVLLHGYPESSAIWAAFRETLSAKYTVVTPDLPGLGQSELLGEVQSMEMMAGAVDALLVHENVQRCVMIGHSMGGYVTMAYADLYPEKLVGIGLFHSLASEDTEEAKANRDRTIQLIRKSKNSFLNQFIPNLFAEHNRDLFDAEIRRMKETASHTSVESLVACMTGMKLRPDRQRVLEELRVPVLFILGKHDSRMPVERIQPQTMLPGVSFTLILGNAGHMGFYEEEKLSMRAVSDFCGQCYSLSEANHSA
jgi:pimeloyl-ACP methyl ester carboxylesterase